MNPFIPPPLYHWPEVPHAPFDEWQGRFWKARGAAKKAISPGAPEPRMKPGFWQRVQYFLPFLPCFPAMFVTFLQRNLLASCLAALAARKPHISNSFWENKLSLRMKVLFLSSLSPAPPPVTPKPPQQTCQDLNGFSCFGKSPSEIMGSWADAGGQDSYERGVVRGMTRGVVCHRWVGCPPRTFSERIWGQRCCAGPFPFTVSKAERCL